ncbi:hypothetical protein JTE90_028745 [Oedothorax gibbosus]|uniref:RRM domain-containing protein n=1 Tax=Oedothorax gibbosus TaxID=931172 RepID=A0AAV6UGW0_9ARAC|nr:hypothetical protein JTE90_028745 [Oedothorax gibbosus]
MAYFGNKKNPLKYLDNQVDPDSLGAETEAERQMKLILEKQLKTNISISEQFSQHRSFVTPSTYKSLTDLVQGTCTPDKFRELENDQEVNQELQRCGLSQDEIKDYLAHKRGKDCSKRLLNPSVLQERFQRIEDKIQAHENELQKPQDFQSSRKLTRHEMDVEKSLYAGCKGKTKMAALVSTQEPTHSSSSMDDAYSYIKDLSHKILAKSSKKRKTLETAVSEEEVSLVVFDSNIHHVIVPLDKEEISAKRLSVEEIKKLPKFGNYDIGVPSKTLYLKNLHPKTTVQELRSIFAHFEKDSLPCIEYRLCTGRMKGQAFVKFQNAESAAEALKFANGFMLRERPLIIEFGKKT